MKRGRGVRHFLVRRRRPTVVLVMAAALVAAGTMTALAITTIISQSFSGTTWPTTWTQVGSVGLTGNSTPSNWLRLTGATNSQHGTAVLNQTFPSRLGITISFEYAMYPNSGGGDGFSFFLIDGAAQPSVGAPGAGLGYACTTADGSSAGACGGANTGVNGGWLGVGFDAYGNFSTTIVNNSGYASRTTNQIVVRGSGSGLTGFQFLTRASAPGNTVVTGNAAPSGTTGVRKVQITILPNAAGQLLLSVSSNTGGTTGMTQVIGNYNLAGASGVQWPPPPTFRLGFAASTGGLNNNHLIRGLTVTAPTSDLRLDKSVSDSTPLFGSNVVYTVTVTNAGPDPATNTLVTDKLPDGMTYVSDDSASSGTTYDPGSGLWNVGTLANGASRTLHITATANTTAATVNRVTGAISASVDPAPCDASDPNYNPDYCGPAVTVTPVAWLSITVPDEVRLPDAPPGGTTSGTIGPVTVDGWGVGGWTATVSWTPFTSGPSGQDTIGLGQISYWSGPATATTGSGTFTPGQVNEEHAEKLTEGGITAFSLTNGSLVNSDTWNPTLTVAVPYGAVAGEYTATITHSVA